MKSVQIQICLITALSLTMSGLLSAQEIPVLIGFKSAPGLRIAAERANLVEKLGGRVKHAYDIIPAVAASVSSEKVAAIKTDPMVSYVEQDNLVYATEETTPWGVIRIGADIVHATGLTGSSKVKVAIIDTGIDYTHSDLNPNYNTGCDFVNGDSDPYDDNGHGTHCAGTVAAAINGYYVVGVAPSVGLLAVKVLDSQGSGYNSDVILGIQWAVAQGASVISMSLGGNLGNTSLQEACDAAYSAGCLLVAAAGNDYSRRGKNELDTVDYPARYSSVIAVAATDNTDRKASFSSTGSTVELAAPGVNIESTYPGGTAIGSGTSMACPHVAGLAALLWSNEPSLSNTELRSRLQNTAEDLGDLGRDTWYGYGLIDAVGAIGVTVVDPTTEPMYVYIIDPSTEAARNKWSASSTVVVSDDSVAALEGATVYVEWSTGATASITTDADGECIFTLNNLNKNITSVTLTVTGVSLDGYKLDNNASISITSPL